jgi:hypothetical protein
MSIIGRRHQLPTYFCGIYQREAEHIARYNAWTAKYCNGIGVPPIRTRRGKPTLHGHYCVDLETGKFFFDFPPDDD